MIFQYTLPKIISGEKTQTRRVTKANEEPRFVDGTIQSVAQSGRTKWRIGKTYAIQPRRGSRQVGRIELKNIRYEPVREISRTDAKKEGFATPQEFFDTWKKIHGEQSLNQKVWVLEFVVKELAID